jgi:hypothetical protein
MKFSLNVLKKKSTFLLGLPGDVKRSSLPLKELLLERSI